MATTYYKRDSGTNWNSNASWSTVSYDSATNTGTYPVATDTAYFVAGSSNCTINVDSACAVVDCTGYTGTLTMAANMTTTGDVKFVAGMTFTPSTYRWTISGTSTLTSAGKSFYDLYFYGGGGNITATITGDVAVTNT